MTTKRFDDNPALKAYTGSEVIPMQSKAGGAATDDSPVAADDDVKITLAELLAMAPGGLTRLAVPSFRDSGDPDDTAAVQAAFDAAKVAGGGVVYFPRGQGTGPDGEYIIGGPLQEPSRSNAQLILPQINAATETQLTIELLGDEPPVTVFSVVGDRPAPKSHSIIRGTLNAGAGGAMIGGWGPVGAAGGWTNIQVVVRNLTLRLPSNPVFTALDCSKCSNADLDELVVDTGSYYIQGLAEPTAATSYGVRMPPNDNGAHSRIGTVNVVGFYNGYEFAEHSQGFATVGAWGCKNAFVFATATNHTLWFDRLMAVHCQRVIVATGPSYVGVAQLNVEHAVAGWWQTVYDIDDPSSYLRGTVNWHVVKAGVGVDSAFSVNGAARLNITRLGWENRVEQVAASADLALSGRHANKHIFHPAADTTARTWTIPANSAAPFPVGTTITFINQHGAGTVTIAIGGSDSMRLVGSGAGGSRLLGANGMATAVKMTDTEWLISGAGLS